jgi:hypothetical protein
LYLELLVSTTGNREEKQNQPIRNEEKVKKRFYFVGSKRKILGTVK